MASNRAVFGGELLIRDASSMLCKHRHCEMRLLCWSAGHPDLYCRPGTIPTQYPAPRTVCSNRSASTF